MGWLEAVVVIYLRRLVGAGVGSVLRAPSGPAWQAVQTMELTRELATLLMIAAVAWLTARGWRQRAGAFAFVFGLWDLVYYLGLRVLAGWPRGPLDWDLLFLIPSAWWGPVLSPVLIAALLVIGGLRLMRTEGLRLAGVATAAAAIGAAALLAVFLSTRPPTFAWLAYLPALALFGWGWLRL